MLTNSITLQAIMAAAMRNPYHLSGLRAALQARNLSDFRPLYSVKNDTEQHRFIRKLDEQKRWANTSSGFFAPSTLIDTKRLPHGIASVIDNNEHLPSLHVPDLSITLEKLKESVSPIAMNSAEFVNTLQLIDKFAKSAGQKLDSLLRMKAEKTKNWLTHDWWVQEIYLKSRKPLVINSNPCMIYPPLPFDVNNQLALVNTISMLVSSVIDFRQALVHGYNPEALSADDECRLDPNLCYNQYRYIFGSTRLPGEHADVQFLKDLSENVDSSTFTIVISFRGKFFEIQLRNLDDERSRIDQIAGILDKIIVSTEASGQGAGVLTTTERETWAKSYRLLDEDSMSAIRESQFIVCIDTIPEESETFSSSLLSSPAGTEDHLAALGRQVLHADDSNIGNRWFDKALQLVLVADSKAERLLGAGINYEHSFAEGVVVTKMIEYSYDKTIQKNRESMTMNHFTKQQFSSSEPASFRQLRMYDESHSNVISGLLDKAKLDYLSQVDQFDLSYWQYKQYGANAIKSWHFSPDSWFQVALQLAFYNTHKRLAPCYESASTRRFSHGRTETIRSLTKEVAQFCLDPCTETLIPAIKSHKAYSIAACNGDAIDRALFGYKMVFQELRSNSWRWGIPKNFEHKCGIKLLHRGENSYEGEPTLELNDIFTEKESNTIISFLNNELILRSLRFALSTSQVSSSHPNIFMAYGPLVADGYGCCYNLTGQQIVAGITANSSNQSFECEVEKLNESLSDSMNKMRDLVGN